MKNRILSNFMLLAAFLGFHLSVESQNISTPDVLSEIGKVPDPSRFDSLFKFPNNHLLNVKATLDTIVRSTTFNGQFITSSVSVFQYSEQGLKTYEEFNEFNVFRRTVSPIRKTYYTYNDVNLLLADTVYRYLIVEAVFALDRYTFREYPADLDNGTYIAYNYKYDRFDDEWALSDKTEIDRVNGLITREADYVWDSFDEEYRLIALDEYEYDGDDNIISFQQFDVENDTLKPVFGTEYEYLNGLIVKRIDFSIVRSLNAYLSNTQRLFEYDTENRIAVAARARIDHTTGVEIIIPTIKDRYEYADNGDLQYVFRDIWVVNNMDYRLGERFDYYYDDFKNWVQIETMRLVTMNDNVPIRKNVRLYNYEFENGEYTTEADAIVGTHMLTAEQSFTFGPDLEEVLNSEFRYIYKFETVQTEQLSDGNEFSIYPNPVSHTLNINNEDSGFHKVHIYNQLGFLVYKGNISGATTVDVQHLQEGVYYLQLIHPSTGQNQTLRFVKL